MSQDSSVGTATSYELGGWNSIPGRVKRFFSTACRLILGALLDSYSIRTRGPFPDDKSAGV
jgi:hypothetical protein